MCGEMGQVRSREGPSHNLRFVFSLQTGVKQSSLCVFQGVRKQMNYITNQDIAYVVNILIGWVLNSTRARFERFSNCHTSQSLPLGGFLPEKKLPATKLVSARKLENRSNPPVA